MRQLSCDEFRKETQVVADQVAATPEIGRFCSSPTWQLAAHDRLHRLSDDGSPHFIVEHEGNWLVFVQHDRQRIFFPFELGWMFGCPLIGDPDGAVDLLLEAARRWLTPPVGFCIGGVRSEGRLHRRLRESQDQFQHYREFPGVDCMILDLTNGCEAWLQRRSRKFRKSLRQNTGLDGVTLELADHAPPNEIYRRIVAIERQTVRWSEGDTVYQADNYADFYRQLIDTLHASGGLRVSFASEQGNDLAYILGGVEGDGFRGLQMSFVESARSRGIGNALQLEMIRRCADDGITHYDLGMHAPYKERWADEVEPYIFVFVALE